VTPTLIIAQKDLRLVLRDRAGLFWIVAFPVLFALFLGAVLERWSARDDLALTIALIDLDRTAESKSFIERLDKSKVFNIEQLPLGQARTRLQRGELDAAVVLIQGFGAVPDWYAGSAEVIRIEADPSRRREASYVKGILLEAGLARAVEDQLTTDPRTSIRVVQTSAMPNEPTAAELVTPAAVLWGLVGCAAAFAISLASERRAGTLRRLRSLPINTYQVLSGKAIACWVACMAIAAIILLGAVFVFRVRLGSGLALSVVVAALAFCFTGIMAAISTLGRSEQSVAGAGWGTLLVLGMVGGIMVPRMIMPSWLVEIGAVSPMRWGLLALEHTLWRGGAIADWLWPSLLLALVGMCGLLAGAFVLWARRS
jgi:ABC-2 type transport system permease protein